LQQVDGLKPSEYLLETAKENIEGKITIDEVKYRIDSYYKQQQKKEQAVDDRTEEADKVAANITEILSEKTFVFNPAELMNIHRRLFTGVETIRVKTGKFRDYNITKSEWVLDGNTVLYASSDIITATLDYDFKEEKNFKYKGLSKQEIVEHIVKFISGIWQIYPFGERNTRTVAVFTIKYLQTFGFKVENDIFASHSWYFRNALVRANYNDYEHKIYATPEFLMKFFGNLLFNEQNELKNRYLHIGFNKQDLHPTGNSNGQKNIIVEKDSVNNEKFSVNKNKFSVNQEKILEMIYNKPAITVLERAKSLMISERAVLKNLAKLKSLGIIAREGADKILFKYNPQSAYQRKKSKESFKS
jgi:fido (protein-threonine AMPylation protein)